MEKVIKVIGRGKVTRQPTHTVATMTFMDYDKDYKKLVAKSTSDLKKAKELLENVGIEKNLIKTKTFEIKPTYDSIKDKNGNYSQVFRNYAYKQVLTFKYLNNNKTLGDILYLNTTLKTNAKIEIDFDFEDGVNFKDETLKSALEDAKKQAEIICLATGAEIDCVGSVIGYDDEENYHEYRPHNLGHHCDLICSENRCDYDIDIMPDDISAYMQIKVTYLLK